MLTMSDKPSEEFDISRIKNETRFLYSTEIRTEAEISSSFQVEDKDCKVSVEPVKSSNEILAELFKVFNAAPPKSLLDDNFLLKKKKRRTKDRKYKRKPKKRSRSSSGGNNSENSAKSNLKRQKKKKKKDKKNENWFDEHTGSSDFKDKETEEQGKSSNNSDFVISEEEECSLKYLTETKNIKSGKKYTFLEKLGVNGFKDSMYLENEKNNCLKQSNEPNVPKEDIFLYDTSDLSLSDEDTYLKEKHFRYYSERSSERKSRYRRTTERSRYDSSKERVRKSWRSTSTRSSSKDRYRKRHRSPSSSDLCIDKKRLLEIARKNAISMFKNGSLPGSNCMTKQVKDKVLLKMRYGGKTIEELTEFCKKLSKGELVNDLSSFSSNEDSEHDKDGHEKPFHHPFVLKDRGPIVMNIKNATPIPPKTAEQTKAILMQYPVSSGQQHRLNESEWIPVSQKKMESITLCSSKSLALKNVFQKSLPAENQKPAFVSTQQLTEVNTTISETFIEPTCSPTKSTGSENVFAQSQLNVDVSSIITKRLNAMRKLQENPADPEALKMMYNSQKDMTAWVSSKFTPGQFTGSTGANILSAKELTAGQQAWVKKDQLTSTIPVSGGMGMHLLQKMGWRPGEGLGKEKNGSLQPLLLEVKLDKRGLLANEEDPTNRRKKFQSNSSIPQIQQCAENKHPVSLLGELSAKRKWGAPIYDIVTENGPAHQRNFIFKVVVNGMMYQPAIPCNTKKEAKALAAKYCLQQIGILPS